eukprot:RCo029886
MMYAMLHFAASRQRDGLCFPAGADCMFSVESVGRCDKGACNDGMVMLISAFFFFSKKMLLRWIHVLCSISLPFPSFSFLWESFCELLVASRITQRNVTAKCSSSFSAVQTDRQRDRQTDRGRERERERERLSESFRQMTLYSRSWYIT